MVENDKSVLGLIREIVWTIFSFIVGYLFIIPMLVYGYYTQFANSPDDANDARLSNFLSSYYTPVFVNEFSCREVNSGTNILIRIVNFAFMGSFMNEYEFIMQSGNLDWIPINSSSETHDDRVHVATYGSDVYQILNNGYSVGQLDLRSGNFGYGPYNGENCESNGIVFGRTWQYN